MIPASVTAHAQAPRRRPAAVAILPMAALAFASLESAVTYVAGQLLRVLGAH